MEADSEERSSVTVAQKGAVAHVKISNPGKRNAFTWKMYDQLQAACEKLNSATDVRVVVFRGDPENGFAAGTDIGQLSEFASGADGVRYEQRVGLVLRSVAAIEVPTVAAVERYAVGAGLAVAASCDIIIAEIGARFGAPIARTIGNCVPIEVVDRLRTRMGVAAATSMLMTARLVPAEDLLSTGFVSQVVAADAMDNEVLRLAARIAAAAPLTLKALKEMGRRLDAARNVPNADDLLELCYGSSDFHEGVQAFNERRNPEWSGT